jgi:ATP-binding cassette subfamily B protein
LVEQVVGTSVSVGLRNAVTAVGGIAYMFVLAPKLAGMMLLAIPAVVVPIILLGRRVRN